MSDSRYWCSCTDRYPIYALSRKCLCDCGQTICASCEEEHLRKEAIKRKVKAATSKGIIPHDSKKYKICNYCVFRSSSWKLKDNAIFICGECKEEFDAE